VGDSLLAQGRPEQAFAVFAAPFDPAKSDAEAANLRFREGAFTAAARAGQRASTDADTYRRAAVAFGISLLLEPDAAQPDVNAAAMEYLERLGVDLDRVALGTLQAPDRLPGLPAYAYSAMDILVYRSKPRLLPFFMHLVQSGDLYLRSRAVLGLGALAYTERSSDPSGWERSAVRFSLRAYGLSSGERNLIEGEVQEAIRSGNFRMRAAGVLAMALMGDDKNVPLLQKALKDRAYMILPQERGRGGKRVYFPVRMAAAAGLARFGINVSPGGGELTGRDFDNARRGGQDVSKDRSGLDRDSIAQVFITPIDVATAIPFDKPKAH
jgi:HEAT repeat protein